MTCKKINFWISQFLMIIFWNFSSTLTNLMRKSNPKNQTYILASKWFIFESKKLLTVIQLPFKMRLFTYYQFLRKKSIKFSFWVCIYEENPRGYCWIVQEIKTHTQREVFCLSYQEINWVDYLMIERSEFPALIFLWFFWYAEAMF